MTSSGPKTLLAAVEEYASSRKGKGDLQGGHQGLSKFINWCRPDRVLSEISPAQIGEFVDRHNGTGTSLQSGPRLQEVRNFLTFARKKGYVQVNLAQHVRIRKSRSAGAAGRVASNRNVVELTADGHARMESELERLKAERLPLAEQIRNAAADGDVRENAPLEAAREQLGHVESRIKDIEATLKASIIIDSSGRRSETVALASKVVIREMKTSKSTTYIVVRADEASPLEGKISNVSPVGRALVGARVGQKVQVETPGGRVRYEIVRITS